MSLKLMHAPLNQAMSEIASTHQPTALQRGLPYLNSKTVAALHQTIAALQPAIAQLEQSLDQLYTELNLVVPTPPDPATEVISAIAIALQQHIQAQEHQLAILRTTYDRALQTLNSLDAIAA